MFGSIFERLYELRNIQKSEKRLMKSRDRFAESSKRTVNMTQILNFKHDIRFLQNYSYSQRDEGGGSG
jgi:hypothetical protein